LAPKESGLFAGVGSSDVGDVRDLDVDVFVGVLEVDVGRWALVSSPPNAITIPMPAATSTTTPTIAPMTSNGTLLPPFGFEPGGGGGVHAALPPGAPGGGGGGPVRPYCCDAGNDPDMGAAYPPGVGVAGYEPGGGVAGYAPGGGVAGYDPGVPPYGRGGGVDPGGGVIDAAGA
jgi:hypothetical protein